MTGLRPTPAQGEAEGSSFLCISRAQLGNSGAFYLDRVMPVCSHTSSKIGARTVRSLISLAIIAGPTLAARPAESRGRREVRRWAGRAEGTVKASALQARPRASIAALTIILLLGKFEKIQQKIQNSHAVKLGDGEVAPQV